MSQPFPLSGVHDQAQTDLRFRTVRIYVTYPRLLRFFPPVFNTHCEKACSRLARNAVQLGVHRFAPRMGTTSSDKMQWNGSHSRTA